MRLLNRKTRSLSIKTVLKRKFRLAKARLISRLDSHIENCPRCRKRLCMESRVEMAMMLIKTQPYKMGLLGKANGKALDVLTHSLRYAPKADALREKKSDISRVEKLYPAFEPFLTAAACLLVLVMIKMGVCNSIKSCKEEGTRTIEKYYAKRVDTETYNEIFPEDTTLT